MIPGVVAGFTRAVVVTAPGAPQNLRQVAPYGNATVNLAWDAPSTGSTPTSYSVYYRNGQSGAYTLWTTTAGQTSSITNQSSAEYHSYYITASNSAGTGPASAVYSTIPA